MSAVSARRIAAEVRDLAKPSHRFTARPVRDDDLREWHFTIRGPPDSDFAGGVYHGRISLPADYPLSPPSFYFISPSGRFETGTKICLSMSAFHPESWSPTWSIRTMLEALAAFMPQRAEGALGSLDLAPETRRRLAEESTRLVCPHCGPVAALLLAAEPATAKADLPAALAASPAAAAAPSAAAATPPAAAAASVAVAAAAEASPRVAAAAVAAAATPPAVVPPSLPRLQLSPSAAASPQPSPMQQLQQQQAPQARLAAVEGEAAAAAAREAAAEREAAVARRRAALQRARYENGAPSPLSPPRRTPLAPATDDAGFGGSGGNGAGSGAAAAGAGVGTSGGGGGGAERRCDNETCRRLFATGETACKRCGGCRGALYCSEVCRQRDWPRHRGRCLAHQAEAAAQRAAAAERAHAARLLHVAEAAADAQRRDALARAPRPLAYFHVVDTALSLISLLLGGAVSLLLARKAWGGGGDASSAEL